MAKRHYESVVIINAALEDDKVDEVIKKIEKTLANGNAEITDVERWGRKRLAYPIRKAKTGYYVVIRFKADPSFIAKLDRFYRLEEQIFRSLIVLLDKEALKYIAQKKAEAEKEATVTVNEPAETKTEEKEEPKAEVSEEKNETVEKKEEVVEETVEETAEATEDETKENDENN